jgi:hypothetical protein
VALAVALFEAAKGVAKRSGPVRFDSGYLGDLRARLLGAVIAPAFGWEYEKNESETLTGAERQAEQPLSSEALGYLRDIMQWQCERWAWVPTKRAELRIDPRAWDDRDVRDAVIEHLRPVYDPAFHPPEGATARRGGLMEGLGLATIAKGAAKITPSGLVKALLVELVAEHGYDVVKALFDKLRPAKKSSGGGGGGGALALLAVAAFHGKRSKRRG